MPLNKSGSEQALKQNIRTLMGEVGSSPHVQSQKQALAIAYRVKRENRAEGGEVDHLIPPPRNPGRAPAGVENFVADMTINPLWDVAQGVGAVASGYPTTPEVGAGALAAMGLMTPGARLAKPVAEGLESRQPAHK